MPRSGCRNRKSSCFCEEVTFRPKGSRKKGGPDAGDGGERPMTKHQLPAAEWRGKIDHAFVLQNGGILQQRNDGVPWKCRGFIELSSAKLRFILPHATPFLQQWCRWYVVSCGMRATVAPPPPVVLTADAYELSACCRNVKRRAPTSLDAHRGLSSHADERGRHVFNFTN